MYRVAIISTYAMVSLASPMDFLEIPNLDIGRIMSFDSLAMYNQLDGFAVPQEMKQDEIVFPDVITNKLPLPAVELGLDAARKFPSNVSKEANKWVHKLEKLKYQNIPFKRFLQSFSLVRNAFPNLRSNVQQVGTNVPVVANVQQIASNIAPLDGSRVNNVMSGLNGLTGFEAPQRYLGGVAKIPKEFVKNYGGEPKKLWRKYANESKDWYRQYSGTSKKLLKEYGIEPIESQKVLEDLGETTTNPIDVAQYYPKELLKKYPLAQYDEPKVWMSKIWDEGKKVVENATPRRLYQQPLFDPPIFNAENSAFSVSNGLFYPGLGQELLDVIRRPVFNNQILNRPFEW